MPVVHVKGVGNVKFPDTMSEQEIVVALQKMPEAAPPIPGVIQNSSPSPEIDALLGAAGATADVATLGFADELASLPALLGEPGSYGKALSGMQERRADFEESNPVSNAAFGLMGVAGLPAAIYKGVTGAWSAPAAPYVAGAVEGGVSAAGFADDDRLSAAPLGAGLGAASTLAGPALDLGTNAVRKGMGYIFGTKSRSAQILQDIIDDSMMTPNQIGDEARRLGPEASLADITGESGIAHGQKILTRNPAARAYARNVMDERAAGAPDRITKALYGNLDEQPGSFEVVQQISKRRSAQAEPIYRNAFKSNEFDRAALDMTDGQRALLEGLEGDAEKIMMAHGSAPGAATDFERLHWMKVALNDKVQSNTDQFGKVNAIGAGYSKMASKINNALKTNPDYKAASALWSDDQGLIEATKAGRKALNPDLRKTLADIKKMSPDEKTAYGASLLETVHNASRNRGAGSASNFNRMEGQRFKDVAEGVIPADRMQVIDDMLDAERRFTNTDTKLLGGSQTAMRQEDEIRYQSVIDAVFQWAKGVGGKMTDEEAKRVSEMLVKPGGALEAMEFARSNKGMEPLANSLSDIVRYAAPVYAGQLAAEMQGQ